MTGSARLHRNGWASFALGLLVAAVSVLISHCLLYFLVAVAFDNYVFEPLFSTTLFSGVVFVILACVIYTRMLYSRKKDNLWLGVSIGKSLGWTLVFVLVFSVVFGSILVATELESFGPPVLFFSILHAIPGVPIALVLITVGILRHRKWVKSAVAQSQLAEGTNAQRS